MPNRAITVVSNLSTSRREQIKSRLLSVGAQLIVTKHYDALSADLREKLSRALNELRIGEVEQFNAPLDVSVWDVNNITTDALNQLVASFRPDPAVSDGNAICLTGSRQVNEVGSIFFWQDLFDKTRFVTSVQNLFEYIYLPVQLALDGTGIFFEERIIDRLIEIGLIRRNDEVTRITDGAGWENLDNLTARLTVDFTTSGNPAQQTLLATALTPLPPITPEAMAETIKQRKALLELLEIPTSILDVRKAVVYHRFIPFELAAYVRGDYENIYGVISDAARIAAILDLPNLEMANLPIEGFHEIMDYYEVSLDSPVPDDLSFVDLLRTDGQAVYWSKFSRPVAKYIGLGSAKNREGLLNATPDHLQFFALQEYERMKKKYETANWLSEKLLEGRTSK